MSDVGGQVGVGMTKVSDILLDGFLPRLYPKQERKDISA